MGKRGAPIGNRNAAGSRGGWGPKHKAGIDQKYGKWLEKTSGYPLSDKGWRSFGYSLKTGKTNVHKGAISGFYNYNQKEGKSAAVYRDTTSKLARFNKRTKW